ncbi:MAG: sugar transferase [Acetivibrio ethanolgignens]
MYKIIKRGMDIVFSMLSLLVLFPFFMIIAGMIKVESKGSIIFKQKRIGKKKIYFEILKFRTMYIDTPKNCPTHMLENPEQYITRIGAFLRKTSLDELPQLWNILKGDMSFVGPRPALWNQKDLIAERDKYGANDVKPGLTGLAQVSGRDELEIEKKARLDGSYVKHQSLLLDIYCIMRTIRIVLKKEGVVEGGTGTLHKIEGK